MRSLEQELLLQIVAPLEAATKPVDACLLLEQAQHDPIVKTRLEAIWDDLRTIFGTTAALGFLFRSHILLAEQRPIDLVLASRAGLDRVQMLLGQMRNSSAI